MSRKSTWRQRNVTPRGERFPFEPLVPLIEARWSPLTEEAAKQTRSVEAKGAQVLDVTRRSLYHWQTNGLTLGTADRVALQLGLHPAVIWPKEYGATAGVNLEEVA